MCGTVVYYVSGVPFVIFHIALVLQVCNVWCSYPARKVWRPSRAFSGFARNFGMSQVECFRVNWVFRKIAGRGVSASCGAHWFPPAMVSNTVAKCDQPLSIRPHVST